jgi:hypothetical protein
MVYVIRKMFFNDGGFDRATAVGIGDITCFSSWKKAEDMVKSFVKNDEEKGNPKYEIYKENLTDMFCDDIAIKAVTYAQQQYDEQNCRVGYTIVQPKIF